ncbi:MAG TPA: PA domain-containing protein [Candidatus Limnocylindrales bacterium]|nr:PA domain-containing protein [Candidatus Limnocylindrales bacterium]
MRRILALLAAATLLATALTPFASAHEGDPAHHAHRLGDGIDDTPLEMDRAFDRVDDEQHGGPGGHLAGSSENVALVGKVAVSGATGVDKPGHIADVTSFGNYAYLSARRLNTSPCGAGGFYTIDISDPTAPSEVGFTAFPPQSYPGEGMHVIRLNTPKFKGDVLLANNENCGTNPARVGGMSIYDVTDPTDITPLAVGKGDTNNGALPRARQIHSVFGWQSGKRAFAIIVDNEEITDVDIMEITDPTDPVHIKEVSILDWPGAHAPLANGESVFLHDMVVKRINGHDYALLSYWDAGWIVLNVDDPENPVFVNDSNYPDPDPLLGFSPPEGNAHQGEWSHNNKYIIGTDEDFSPSRLRFEITTGPNAGFYGGGQFGWTVPISASNPFTGSTVWGGTGCIADVNGNGISDRAEVPSQSSSGAGVVVFTRGTCTFSEKVETGQLAGYSKVIIFQSHGGTRSGLTPNGFTCGSQGHAFTITASAICIGHRAGHLLFNDSPEFVGAPEGVDMPAIGTLGASVSATTTFDGWGTIHLLDAKTLEEIDNYSIPEAIDPAYASGFGTMSVHEVATDKDEDLAYLSWYDAGIRVIRFGADGIEEVGHYVDSDGNDFWGVEAHRLPGDPTETTYILGSDRDSGLWIFRYTGN